MTTMAAQLAALAALAGRALSAAETEQIEDLLPARRDDLIAALLSVGRTHVVPRMTSARGLAELFVLMKLEGAAAAMKASADQQQKVLGSLLTRQLGFLAAEGLDFGSAALRGMLDQLAAAGVLTADEAAGLKVIAVKPNPLPTNAVSDALNALEI